MKTLRINKNLKRLVAYVFALSCLFPVQVVLALQDCGTHEVVSCEEHDNDHFVAKHVEDTKVEVKAAASDFSLSESNEEHDSAHQIEKSKQGLATISEISNEIEYTPPFLGIVSNKSFQGQFIQSALWPNAPPDADNSFLSFLPSIRLQV